MSKTPDIPDASSLKDQPREPLLVYFCEECGKCEGASPQAGCCRFCGASSNSDPRLVVGVVGV